MFDWNTIPLSDLLVFNVENQWKLILQTHPNLINWMNDVNNAYKESTTISIPYPFDENKTLQIIPHKFKNVRNFGMRFFCKLTKETPNRIDLVVYDYSDAINYVSKKNYYILAIINSLYLLMLAEHHKEQMENIFNTNIFDSLSKWSIATISDIPITLSSDKFITEDRLLRLIQENFENYIGNVKIETEINHHSNQLQSAFTLLRCIQIFAYEIVTRAEYINSQLLTKNEVTIKSINNFIPWIPCHDNANIFIYGNTMTHRPEPPITHI